MTLHVAHTGVDVYDDELDVWRRFPTVEAVEEFLASFTDTDTGESTEQVEEVSGDYDTFWMTVNVGDPPKPVVTFDPNRKSVQIEVTSTGGGLAYFGKPHVLGTTTGTVGQNGYGPKGNGQELTIEAITPVYVVTTIASVTLAVLVLTHKERA